MKILQIYRMTDVELQMRIKAKSMQINGLQKMLQDKEIPNHILSSFWDTLQIEMKNLEGLQLRAEESAK